MGAVEPEPPYVIGFARGGQVADRGCLVAPMATVGEAQAAVHADIHFAVVFAIDGMGGGPADVAAKRSDGPAQNQARQSSIRIGPLTLVWFLLPRAIAPSRLVNGAVFDGSHWLSLLVNHSPRTPWNRRLSGSTGRSGKAG